MDCLVQTIEQQIQLHQDVARARILELIKRARTEDPNFFKIPFNPFNAEETDSDEDEDEEAEEERSSKWLSSLKASHSPTAKELLKIRKELYERVHASLDEFRYHAAPDAASAIPPPDIFSSLYCRLLQLEYIL